MCNHHSKPFPQCVRWQDHLLQMIHIQHYLQCSTVTVHRPTKSNKGKWRKWAKWDYLIEAGIIWAQNRCPGSDNLVACQGWTVDCGAGDSRFVSRGNPLFGSLPFRREMKNPLWELRINQSEMMWLVNVKKGRVVWHGITLGFQPAVLESAFQLQLLNSYAYFTMIWGQPE